MGGFGDKAGSLRVINQLLRSFFEFLRSFWGAVLLQFHHSARNAQIIYKVQNLCFLFESPAKIGNVRTVPAYSIVKWNNGGRQGSKWRLFVRKWSYLLSTFKSLPHPSCGVVIKTMMMMSS